MLLQQKVVVSQSCGGSAVPCADHLKISSLAEYVSFAFTGGGGGRKKSPAIRPQVKRQVATFDVLGYRGSSFTRQHPPKKRREIKDPVDYRFHVYVFIPPPPV